MSQTPQSIDERLDRLVVQTTRLTGESEVEAVCHALEERLERLVSSTADTPSARVIRVRLEAEFPEEFWDPTG